MVGKKKLQYCSPEEITPFLHDNGFVLSKLASAQPQQQLMGLLKQAISKLEESGSSHSGNTNEDDYYGIPSIAWIKWGEVKDEEEDEDDGS